MTENVIICVRLPAIGRRRALLTSGVSRFRFYYYLTNENNARRGSDVFKTERDHFRSDRNQKRQLQLFYVRQSSREGRAFIHETVRRRSLHVPRKFSAEFFTLFLFDFYGRRNSASPAGNRTNCPLYPNRQPQTYYTSVISVVLKRTGYIGTNEKYRRAYVARYGRFGISRHFFRSYGYSTTRGERTGISPFRTFSFRT